MYSLPYLFIPYLHLYCMNGLPHLYEKKPLIFLILKTTQSCCKIFADP
jgi:hypothetical protein